MCRPNLDSLWAVIALSTWLPLFCCAESISSLHGSCWLESYRWCFQPQRSQRDCSGLFIARSLPTCWPNRCRARHPVPALTHPRDPWPRWRCAGTCGPPGGPVQLPPPCQHPEPNPKLRGPSASPRREKSPCVGTWGGLGGSLRSSDPPTAPAGLGSGAASELSPQRLSAADGRHRSVPSGTHTDCTCCAQMGSRKPSIQQSCVSVTAFV